MRNMKRSTIKDVARLAEVSETAVSLAFQEGSRLSDATRELVLRSARELRYTPNQAARNLRQGKGDSFGFVVNDVTNPFYGMMFREAERLVAEGGHGMLFRRQRLAGRPRGARRPANGPSPRPGRDALPLRAGPGKTIEILDTHQVPYIAVDSYPDAYRGAYVANDLQGGRGAGGGASGQGCDAGAPAFFHRPVRGSGFQRVRPAGGGFSPPPAKRGAWPCRPRMSSPRALTVAEGIAACADALRNGGGVRRRPSASTTSAPWA